MATDFFQRQDNAKRGTQVLLFGMVGGTAGIILTVYLVFASVFVYASSSSNPKKGQQGHAATSSFSPSDLNLNRFWNPTLFGIVSIATAGVILGSMFFKTLELRSGGEAVALSLGGRQIPPNASNAEERRLLNIVEEMAIASGVPVPKTFILEDEEGINAFAAGHTPDDAAVAVTRGLLRRLTRDELQGVIAHEFSHILNGDMRLNLRLIALIAGIMSLTTIGYVVMRIAGSSSSSRDSKNNGAALAIFGVALMIIGWVGSFFGHIMQAAVSRQREFLADASAVQFTRNPDGIAGALKKIGALSQGSRMQNPKADEVGHLFFGSSGGWSFANFLATHPPLEDRIRAIDPNFDGVFPEIDLDVDHSFDQDEPPPSTSRKPAGFPLPFPFPFPGADPHQRIPVAAAMHADHMGSPTSEQLDQAHGIITEIPAQLQAAVRDPFAARAVIFALLLNKESDPRQRQTDQLQQATDRGTLAEFRKIVPLVEQIHPALRLPLVELSLPALGMMNANQYEAFRANVEVLIDADGDVSLFEYMITRVVLRGLDRQILGEQTSSSADVGMPEIQQACETLLAKLAQASAARQNQAFQTALQQLGLPVKKLPRQNISIDDVHDALVTLESVDSHLKRRLLKAAVACVEADGSISVDEAELLRAVAAALDCPTPPIMAQAG